ncbi:MAG: RNA polymerase sigma factor [Thermoleophilia bacterium]|nr:RNA polymerase sigma factor [Thermoleophilia bacterium]MDQ3859131.1 RNA polymerase sigma factor [Actinomycetota bacterium]
MPIIVAYRKLGDLALVAKAKAGDRPALDVLVERHAPRVNRLAAQLMGDFEDARDAAQESLVKLCTRLRQFRGEAQFATWVHRLVVNTCHDFQDRKRVRATEPLPATDEAAGDDADPTRAHVLADLRRDLADAFARLSPDQRAVVVLRDVLDLSYEDVALAARIPVGTAKCYVHRGRERLRERLEEGVATSTGPTTPASFAS